LIGHDEARLDVVAAAVSSLSKGRLADVLRLNPPDLVLSKILLRARDKDISEVPDESLLSALMSNSEAVRKVLAIRVIRVAPKKRLRHLLGRYAQHGSQRYYNVFHWLDFGISLPRHRVLDAADRALAKLR